MDKKQVSTKGTLVHNIVGEPQRPIHIVGQPKVSGSSCERPTMSMKKTALKGQQK